MLEFDKNTKYACYGSDHAAEIKIKASIMANFYSKKKETLISCSLSKSRISIENFTKIHKILIKKSLGIEIKTRNNDNNMNM